MERYARQAMIEGWDQDRLTETTLLVVGSGLLARLTGLLAVAMGFGRVVMMGDGRVGEEERRFLLADALAGTSLVRMWTEALRRINPEVEVDFVHDAPCERSFDRTPRADVVVEASSSLRWKAQVLQLARSRQLDLVTAAAGPQVGLYQVGRRVCRDLLKFRGVKEDPLVSLAFAALVVEEVRRVRMPLGPADRPASGPVLVSPEALHRRAGGTPVSGLVSNAAEASRIALVGAGALGTWAGIGLGLAGEAPMQLTIYDPDGIEATNLNRQVLFAGDLYRPKAEVLAERLSTLFPKIDAEGRSRPIFS